MVTKDQLQEKVTPLDRMDYGGFQSLIGTYDFEQFVLIIEQIPKDSSDLPIQGFTGFNFLWMLRQLKLI